MGLLGAVSNSGIDLINGTGREEHFEQSTIYGSTFAAEEIPKYEMNEEACPADTAYQLITDELELDGTPALNLASFVTTYMEPQAEQLMTNNLAKNFIDYEEYGSTVEIHNRCVNIIARLFNAPLSPGADALGVSTIGSSEAIILATLAMKRKWQNARKAAGKPWDKPNMIMNSAVQVCWEKATRYLEIEEKYVYCTMDRYVIDPKEAVDLVDENTIGIVGILGTTYTGEYEDIKELNRLLDIKQEETGLDVKIHVDAASGGFVAPFVVPDLEWDFRLPRVVSINTSGHKYGLTYAGVGWALWRSKDYLPEELVFHVNYLGSDQASFTLNFSRSAIQVLGQYYVLIRNGKSGFRAIMNSVTATADFLCDQLQATGRFTIMSPNGGKSLPLVAFRLKEKHAYDEFAIAAKLREKGWIIPAYTMAPHSEKMKLLRVTCRMDFSRSRCLALLRDLMATMNYLDTLTGPVIEAMLENHKDSRKAKHHARHGVHHGDDSTNLQGKTGKTHAIC